MKVFGHNEQGISDLDVFVIWWTIEWFNIWIWDHFTFIRIILSFGNKRDFGRFCYSLNLNSLSL